MAIHIQYGKTPAWGIEQQFDGVILDSLNLSVEAKDYEQIDQNGAVCGYLQYDQTASFDMSGVVLRNSVHSLDNKNFAVGAKLETFDVNCFVIGHYCGFGSFNHSIIKNMSISRTAGGATTFSASGTAYSFEQN